MLPTKKTNIRIKYFTCKQGEEHQGQALNYVCLEKSCPKIGLLCSICKVNHPNHTIIPLKLLLSSLQTHKQQPMESSQGFQNQLEQLEDQYKILMYELRISVEALAEQYRNLQNHLNQQFSKTKIELLERVQMNMKFNNFVQQAIKNQISDRQSFEADINRISSMIELKENNQVKFNINLNNVVDKFKNFKKMTVSKLKNIQKLTEDQKLLIDMDEQIHSEQEVKVAAHSIVPKKNKKQIKYNFSSSLKAASIVVGKNNMEAKQTKSGEQRFVFVEQGLGMPKQKIAFRMLTLKNWIGIGIGLREKLKSVKFGFQYNQLKHGSYLVSSNGYSWSHSEKEDNISLMSFKFKEGDIIEVMLQVSQIHFQKRGTNQKFKLKVNLSESELKQVCFCANLCSEGDAIEIMDF